MNSRSLKINKKLKEFVVEEHVYPSEHLYVFRFAEEGYGARVRPNHNNHKYDLWDIDLLYYPSSRATGRDIGWLRFVDAGQVNKFLCLIKNGKIQTSANIAYGKRKENKEE